MRKVFNKILAGVTTVALVATLAVGIGATTAKADEVSLGTWTFKAGGDYAGQPNNYGIINSVKTSADESITGWSSGAGAPIEEKTASSVADGFTIDIGNTGWDAQWNVTPNQINPWAIEASMKNIAAKAGHTYTVTFTAQASKTKYAYIGFGSDVLNNPDNPDEGSVPPFDTAGLEDGSNYQAIKITTTPQTYTYKFTNWISAKQISVSLMLGAFDAEYGYAGEPMSTYIEDYKIENNWSGTVIVSDFSVVDEGQNKDFVEAPDKPTVQPTTPSQNVNTTTKAPTTATTKAPAVKAKKKLAKVKKLKVKNTKKRTIKITWKKVSKAKSYQVKVGKKTYTTKKVKLTVKKLKKGRRYTVKVRAKAAGYKTGAWATKKIKIKK